MAVVKAQGNRPSTLMRNDWVAVSKTRKRESVRIRHASTSSRSSRRVGLTRASMHVLGRSLEGGAEMPPHKMNLLSTPTKPKELYAALGLPPDASDEMIKKAWRWLAMRHHPDLNNGAASDEFARIQHAYAILGDPEFRELYDKYDIFPREIPKVDALAQKMIVDALGAITKQVSPDDNILAIFKRDAAQAKAEHERHIAGHRRAIEKAQRSIANIERYWKRGEHMRNIALGLLREQIRAAAGEMQARVVSARVCGAALAIAEQEEYALPEPEAPSWQILNLQNSDWR